jgi:hypothetical protein
MVSVLQASEKPTCPLCRGKSVYAEEKEGPPRDEELFQYTNGRIMGGGGILQNNMPFSHVPRNYDTFVHEFRQQLISDEQIQYATQNFLGRIFFAIERPDRRATMGRYERNARSAMVYLFIIVLVIICVLSMLLLIAIKPI